MEIFVYASNSNIFKITGKSIISSGKIVYYF